MKKTVSSHLRTTINDILEETEIAVECSVLDIRFSSDVGRSMFDVHLLI